MQFNNKRIFQWQNMLKNVYIIVHVRGFQPQKQGRLCDWCVAEHLNTCNPIYRSKPSLGGKYIY